MRSAIKPVFFYFLNRGAIEAIAVFAKLPPPSGESLLEASVSSLCLTGDFLHIIYTHLVPVVHIVLLSAGFTITSSTRRGSQCLSEATLQFSSTTDPSAPGSGTDDIRNYENINISTMLCFHRRSNPARYDRKDPGVVAISLSPEASLLLGFKRSFFLLIFEVPKDHHPQPFDL